MDVATRTRKENEERVAEEYLSSLSELICNSKPYINMLTILAEENKECAQAIVSVVEQHISKVQSEYKLPILYLIDSIVKNVKEIYVQLFSQCIVNIFCDVFEKVNEKVRERMYALRQTWNEVFAPQKLYALDVKVKHIDKNWPITAKLPQPSIHVNPNFLKTVNATQTMPSDMEEILQAKTRELLELKKRKLELELEVTNKRIEEQEKQLSKTAESVNMPPVEILVTSNALPSNATGMRMPQNMVPPNMVANTLIPPQHQMHATGPPGMRPGIYHQNFRNTRPQGPRMMPLPPKAYGPMNNLIKPKVHPVNPALLNTVRPRDPRLARQQQQQQQQQQQLQLPLPQLTRGNTGRSSAEEMKAESKSSSSSSYRNSSSSNSKSSRSGYPGGSGSGSESKSPTRHSLTSSRSSKSNASRDKDRNRKRSESKSSTSSSSSSVISSERRKNSASSSSRGDKSSSSSTKCDKDAFEIAPLSTAFKRKSSPPASPSKTKESKQPTKSRSYKNRSHSPSPTIDSTKDVDLRIIAAPINNAAAVAALDKRQKPNSDTEADKEEIAGNAIINATPAKDYDKTNLSTVSTIANNANANASASASSVTKQLATLDMTKASKLADHVDVAHENAAAEKLASSSNVSSTTQPEPNATEAASLMAQSTEEDGKKRPLVDAQEGSPLPKKSKSAKLDALFGTEDVDLRTVMPAQILNVQKQAAKNDVLTPPPPPMISDEQNETSSSSPNAENWTNSKANVKPIVTDVAKGSPKKTASSSNLDDVRAKLAKAAKYNKLGKFEKSNKELSQRFKLAELNTNDDTQEVNDEKIRNILTQAQEMLDTNSMSQEQYRHLLQTLMSINEMKKLREAKRRENAKSKSAVQVLSDDDDINDSKRIAAAREAVRKKRIPKKHKDQVNESNERRSTEDASATAADSSLFYEDRNNDSNEDSNGPKPKMFKEKPRTKSSKWVERVDTTVNVAPPQVNMPPQQRSWVQGPLNKRTAGFRSTVPHPPLPPLGNPSMHSTQMPWLMPGLSGQPPNVSFGNQMPPIMHTNLPPPPQAPTLNLPPAMPTQPPPVIPKPCNSIDNPQADLVRSITIDGLTKEIRIYDQIAIVFMDQDQPREIGFQAGQRAISLDHQEPITLNFNDDYKTFNIDGEPHRLRFGFPSRELYIDEHWYEIYFGGPAVSLPIKNKLHILKAEGPPPQVNIGPLRRDLVAGKINMIVDMHTIVPLFLDARVQTFRLDKQEHTIQFADGLLTVLLNGEVNTIEYGGLPKYFNFGDKKYYIRFGALPQGMQAGKVHIKDMLYIKTTPPAVVEMPKIEAKTEVVESTSLLKPATEKLNENDLKPDLKKTDPMSAASTNATSTNANSGMDTATITTTATTSSTTNTAVPPPALNTAAIGNLNIDELYKKLISSGILSATTGITANANKPSNAEETSNMTTTNSSSTPEPLALVEIRPIDLTKTETIKTRQAGIVATLFSGMQCSSCGVRFPPKQTMKYRQHLDWHFHKNSRKRDSSRKAHSRDWYYDLSNWMQYEDIEDLETREKSLIESQQNDLDTHDDISNQRSINSPVPSCAAEPDDVDRTCDMCHEKFEQFYNEELEEWHLRLAVRVEDKIYHPLCYEDYKSSLNPPKPVEAEQNAQDKEIVTGDDDNAVDIIIKLEGDENSDVDITKVTIVDDDDDVIMLPAEEPSVTEIVDDDDIDAEEEEYVPQNVTREEMGKMNEGEDATFNDTAESDVEIQEPNIPFTDLDTYVEKELPDLDEASQLSFLNVKIKEEPKDDDEEDDGFEDVGTVVLAPEEEISIHSSENTQTQIIASETTANSPVPERPASVLSLVEEANDIIDATSTTAIPAAVAELSLSMDGNMEPESEHNLSAAGPAPAVPLASLVNRIKINITKNNVTNNSNSNSSSNNTNVTAAANATAAATQTTTNASTTTNNSLNCNSNEQQISSLGHTSSNNSSIPVISTIPVLCGGGTTIPTISTSLAMATNPAKDSTISAITTIGTVVSGNVSNISVIGSYGSNSSASNTTAAQFQTNKPVAAKVIPRQPTPPPATPAPPVEETISYELKPALQKAALKKTKKIERGTETSGLCSLM